MKFTNSVIIILIVLFALASCKDDDLPEVIPPDDPIDTIETHEQYGTPFQYVPEASDIVMYEVNLRAFSPGGNLQSVINRLDNIQDLGINVIWLMPIHPIGDINSVNSPYSVKDYLTVSSEYGSLDDLRRLTDEAHSRGIAVILDWVANHTSWDNDWVSDKSWYTQDASGNIIHPPGTNWLDVADLNYGNTDMRSAMIDAMKYWVLEANVDGFRCDYADGVPFDFWKQAIDTLSIIPDREYVFLAEGTRADHFNAGFHLNFGWNFYGAIKQAFGGQSASQIFISHNNEYNNVPQGKHWLRFTTNHDESAWDETPISLFNGVDGALAASVVSTYTGGVPLLFSGQEVGTENNVPFFSNSTTNWSDNPGMLLSYEEMMQFYVNSDIAKRGVNTIYNDYNVVCLKKTFNDEEILILVNIRNTSIVFNLPGELENTTWKNVFDDTNLELGNEVQMESYQYLILKE